MPAPRLRFGAFIAPFHPVGENPTRAIERDLALVEWMDELGFDEAWIGEHHSGGLEIIASPEVFIAAAAERTKHIRLGTGVYSLPYHHPLMLADRIMQLDHMTRGRVMFGVGPGALPSDAFMMGIPVAAQRDRMDEAIGVLNDLFYVCAPTPLQHAVAHALATVPESYYRNLATDYQQKRDLLVATCRDLGWQPRVPAGAYYLMAEPKGLQVSTARVDTSS